MVAACAVAGRELALVHLLLPHAYLDCRIQCPPAALAAAGHSISKHLRGHSLASGTGVIHTKGRDTLQMQQSRTYTRIHATQLTRFSRRGANSRIQESDRNHDRDKEVPAARKLSVNPGSFLPARFFTCVGSAGHRLLSRFVPKWGILPHRPPHAPLTTRP